MSNDYEQGMRNGKTEATLEGIASKIDDIMDKVNNWPTKCEAHRANMHLRINGFYYLMITLLIALIGLAVFK